MPTYPHIEYQHQSPAIAIYQGAVVEVVEFWQEAGRDYCRVQFPDGGQLTVLQSQIMIR